MSAVIDLIASAVIASYVVFMGLRVNMNMNSTAVASTTNVTVQESMVEAAKLLEQDLKKIGFGLIDPTTAVAIADSNRVRFLADMNKNGSIDSVEWYVGNMKVRVGTPNDTVWTLYRKYNNGTPQVAATYVRQFKLKFLDQDGGVTNMLTNIALIETTLEISSPYKVADQVNPDTQDYVTTLWRQGRVTARNIKRHG